MVFALTLAAASFALLVFACVSLARSQYRWRRIQHAARLEEALQYYDRRQTPRDGCL